MPQQQNKKVEEWEKKFDEEWNKLWEKWGNAGGYQHNPNADYYIGIGIKSFIRQLLQAERKKKIMAIDKKIVKELPGTKEFEDILEEVRKKERKRIWNIVKDWKIPLKLKQRLKE